MPDLLANHAASRLFAHDYTLWSDEPTEITNRLDWLTEPHRIRNDLDAIRSFADDARNNGVDRVVWCGMGGSSLFPELLATSGLTAPDSPAFMVLDSSHPQAVLRAEAFANGGTPLVVVASKSGGTIETRSHLEYLLHHLPHAQFAVVTDAGSALDQLASARNFRGIFHANPNIGGRYSALSHFGIVAAGLLGVDLDALLDGGCDMLRQCASDDPSNPGLQLGARMGEWATGGRDKLVADCAPSIAAWLEQLIAESTGKNNRGILPVPGGVDDARGDDRVRVSYGRGGDVDLGSLDCLGDARTLGAELVRWEVATAIASVTMGINPFDQPDVEAAKVAAAASLARATDIAEVSLETAIANASAPQYVAIQAFVDPAGEVAGNLEAARQTIIATSGCATTATIGPRYLHSTGQYHKGGVNNGVFVQVIDRELTPLPIPGRDFGFHDLLRAQAAGDYVALTERGRTVARVNNL